MAVLMATARHVMDYLWKAALNECDPWLRSDVRQAYTTVSLARRGEPQPFVQASYYVYGKHPDKVWPAIMHTRRAKLGKEFSDWYDAAGNPKPDVPKKKPMIYIFPKRENVPETGIVRRGNLYQMPSAARQSLRILPADEDSA